MDIDDIIIGKDYIINTTNDDVLRGNIVKVISIIDSNTIQIKRKCTDKLVNVDLCFLEEVFIGKAY